MQSISQILNLTSWSGYSLYEKKELTLEGQGGDVQVRNLIIFYNFAVFRLKGCLCFNSLKESGSVGCFLPWVM